jgi:ATP-dependent DNA helicase DinG
MLDDETKGGIRAAFQKLQQRRPGFRSRGAQNRMIADIARCVGRDDGAPARLVVEAPTGTGKSLAYLLGAIAPALKRGKKIVIATATVALQQQLLSADVPALSQHADLQYSARLAKGRTRYVCPMRLAQLDRHDPDQAGLDFGDEHEPDTWEAPPSQHQVGLATDMAQAWREGRWDGDLDTWPEAVPEDARPFITATRTQCLGKQCAHYDRCPFVIARRGLLASDVIVANQNLVLSDLEGGGGVILPAPENTVYIIDEAHHFPGKAVEQFVRSLDPEALRTLLQRAKGPLAAAARAVQEPKERIEDLATSIEELRKRLGWASTMLAPAIAHAHATSTAARHRDVAPRVEVLLTDPAHSAIWDWARELAPMTHQAATYVLALLDRVADAAKEQTIAPAVYAVFRTRLATLGERLETTHECLRHLARAPDPSTVPTAKWCEATRGTRPGLRLFAGPINAAEHLREALWEKADTVILTSATLSTLGSFDRFLDETGLAPDDTAQLRLPSPFNLEAQAALRVVGGPASRDRSEEHTQDVVAAVQAHHAPDAGSLVLFTSHAQLRQVYDALPDALRARVLRQGDASRDELLAQHARRIAAGEASLLFGVNQLAEGLDLPRELCRAVIIAKLPFPVPDSPVEKTREAWIRASGRDYFNEVVVPEAHLRLTQMCGRLIRTAEDTGVIVVVDARLKNTRYGRRMLDALPPYRRVA